MLNISNAFYILKKYWDPRIGENVRNMKAYRDGSGVVFDIRSDTFEKFMDNYDRIKETDPNANFELQKCTELPDLEDEQGYGNNQNWRDQGNSYGGGRGGGRGGYQSRGGYDRGGNDWGRGNDRGYGGRGGGGNDWGRNNDRGYDNQDSYGGGGGNWRDQDRSGGGGYQKRGGYQQ